MPAELSWIVVGTVVGAATFFLGLIMVVQNRGLKKLLGIVKTDVQPIRHLPTAKRVWRRRRVLRSSKINKAGEETG
jgi:hypothetical protein